MLPLITLILRPYQRNCITIDLCRVGRVVAISFRSTIAKFGSGIVQELMGSIKRALADILDMSEVRCTKGFAADARIRGWERPLRKVVVKAIVAARPSSSKTSLIAQVEASLDAHASLPEVFSQILRLICSHCDHGAGNSAFQGLHTIGVANGIPPLLW